MAQGVAGVAVGLRHQGRVGQVGAVQREDGGREQAALGGLRMGSRRAELAPNLGEDG